jgi:hypothetical protein
LGRRAGGSGPQLDLRPEPRPRLPRALLWIAAALAVMLGLAAVTSEHLRLERERLASERGALDQRLAERERAAGAEARAQRIADCERRLAALEQREQAAGAFPAELEGLLDALGSDAALLALEGDAGGELRLDGLVDARPLVALEALERVRRRLARPSSARAPARAELRIELDGTQAATAAEPGAQHFPPAAGTQAMTATLDNRRGPAWRRWSLRILLALVGLLPLALVAAPARELAGERERLCAARSALERPPSASPAAEAELEAALARAEQKLAEADTRPFDALEVRALLELFAGDVGLELEALQPDPGAEAGARFEVRGRAPLSTWLRWLARLAQHGLSARVERYRLARESAASTLVEARFTLVFADPVREVLR